MTYVTNRNASVILVPVAVYVGMGDPEDLAAEPFLLKGGRREVGLGGGGVEEGQGSRGSLSFFAGRAWCYNLPPNRRRKGTDQSSAGGPFVLRGKWLAREREEKIIRVQEEPHQGPYQCCRRDRAGSENPRSHA